MDKSWTVVFLLNGLLIGYTASQTVINLLDSEAEYNTTAVLTCTISPNTSTVTMVTWIKAPAVQVFSSASGAFGDFVGRVNGTFTSPGHFELHLYNPTIRDSGTFSCTMFVGGVPASDTGDLTVTKSPDIDILPPSLDNIKESYNQTFNCSSGPSYPAVSLTWSCIGVVCSVVQGTTENSTEIPSAVITKLQTICPLHNSTNCTCEASSGHSAMAIVTFRKEVDPNITSGLDNQTLTVGQSYGINCEADGFPTLVIEWIKEATGGIVSNSSFLNILNAAVSDSGWYICNASSSSGAYDFKRFYIQVIGPPTTTGMTEVIRTTVPPNGEAELVAALVTLIIISFISSCSVCIFVCIKYPDKKSSLKCIVDCVCITVVFLCVILGNICGGVLWRTIDPNQDVGIIVLVIILSDLGFFILGIVVGIIKDCKEQTPDKDKVLRDILVKLPNIVLSVATFGGVSAGISIAFSCKNGKTRRASITPEERQTNPRRENSANSKDSAASQSGVPLHEGIGHSTREESDTIPMQKIKKKKKKKPEKRSKEPYIQKVPSPRKLPPLKT